MDCTCLGRLRSKRKKSGRKSAAGQNNRGVKNSAYIEDDELLQNNAVLAELNASERRAEAAAAESEEMTALSIAPSNTDPAKEPDRHSNSSLPDEVRVEKAPTPHQTTAAIHGSRRVSHDEVSLNALNMYESVDVDLISRDVTGIGVSVVGNLSDGIIVSEVLPTGPAAESGKINSGDRIVAVTVSFENIVYEDALTILSYASPYPLTLRLTRGCASPAAVSKCVSIEGDQARSVCHPIYRSQSLGDGASRHERRRPIRPGTSLSQVEYSALMEDQIDGQETLEKNKFGNTLNLTRRDSNSTISTTDRSEDKAQSSLSLVSACEAIERPINPESIAESEAEAQDRLGEDVAEIDLSGIQDCSGSDNTELQLTASGGLGEPMSCDEPNVVLVNSEPPNQPITEQVTVLPIRTSSSSSTVGYGQAPEKPKRALTHKPAAENLAVTELVIQPEISTSQRTQRTIISREIAYQPLEDVQGLMHLDAETETDTTHHLVDSDSPVFEESIVRTVENPSSSSFDEVLEKSSIEALDPVASQEETIENTNDFNKNQILLSKLERERKELVKSDNQVDINNSLDDLELPTSNSDTPITVSTGHITPNQGHPSPNDSGINSEPALSDKGSEGPVSPGDGSKPQDKSDDLVNEVLHITNRVQEQIEAINMIEPIRIGGGVRRISNSSDSATSQGSSGTSNHPPDPQPNDNGTKVTSRNQLEEARAKFFADLMSSSDLFKDTPSHDLTLSSESLTVTLDKTTQSNTENNNSITADTSEA